MPLFSSKNSWTNQAKGESTRAGLFGSKSWTANANKREKARKQCPPVKDCNVKKTLMASAREQQLWGVRTKKEVAQAKQQAAKIARQQRAGKKEDNWPYKGKYDPTKGKGRGR